MKFPATVLGSSFCWEVFLSILCHSSNVTDGNCAAGVDHTLQPDQGFAWTQYPTDKLQISTIAQEAAKWGFGRH